MQSVPDNVSPDVAADTSASAVQEDVPTDLRGRVLQILERTDRRAKALLAAGRFLSEDGDELQYAVPNSMHLDRCTDHSGALLAATCEAMGRSVSVHLVVDPNGGAPLTGPEPSDGAPVVSQTRRHLSIAPEPIDAPLAPEAEEDIDLSALIDANEAEAPSILNELTKAFPGATIMEETS